MEAEAVAAALGIVAIALEEFRWGKLRRCVTNTIASKRTARDAHESIPEVLEATERIEDQMERVDENVLEVKETVAYLHRDDLQDDPLARDRLNVELEDDLIQGDD